MYMDAALFKGNLCISIRELKIILCSESVREKCVLDLHSETVCPLSWL